MVPGPALPAFADAGERPLARQIAESIDAAASAITVTCHRMARHNVGVASTSTDDDPLLLYEQLVSEGQAPDPRDFAARFPEHPDLLAQLQELDALRNELDSLAVQLSGETRELPERVGGYELAETLGSGGMGTVFAARAPDEQRVAVKLVVCETTAARRRFQREAKLAATLQHPGIVRVLDHGIEGDVGYVVTELLAATSLEDLLAAPIEAPESQRAPHGVTTILRMVAAVADALAHAHRQGVIHRDVKPANILVTQTGQPKLIDFGVARPREGATAEHLTRTGVFVGTRDYAAPEQLRPDWGRIGPWTDTFALGAVLYEWLSGDNFFARYPAAARRAAPERVIPPPLCQARADIEPRVDMLVQRAVNPALKARFADGKAFAKALRRCIRRLEG